ncbi:DNA repair protein rad5 [Favolaschia claudopus]|uniref:DNA repair protein rad5 n=1 Tax=Favolaschia claudopus TaxID=2862362 RepID=A0AAW0A8Z1_9AGAR
MSQSAHVVGYSKSANAKCHAQTCQGSPLPPGTLRYGATATNAFGETTVEWRHWGCVTASQLSALATVTMDRVKGFNQLVPADQAKIRKAISLRHVDPGDVPATANSAGQKRARAEFETGQASSSTVNLVAEDDEEQEVIEIEPDQELYVSMVSEIVGVQYYSGMVGAGEEVRLTREPTNQYDRNAIKVQNISSTQVGHIPRNVAAKLSPLLDQKLVSVEGVMNAGNVGARKVVYALGITLKIYGPADKRQELEPRLIWATPGQRGFSTASSSRALTASLAPRPSQAGTSTQRPSGPQQTAAQKEAIRKQQEAYQKAADLKKMLSSLEHVDDEERRSSLLDQLLSTDDILKLPVHPDPPGKGNGLVIDLMKHQSQALQWALERENPVLPKTETDRPVQFWQFKKNGAKSYYYNLATKTPQETPPVLGRGALCADSMGLGKTLTMLALILATKVDVPKPKEFSNSTLIVAPLSILSNWEKQIEDHCESGALTYYVYYGTKRDIGAKDLQKYDVVITTYQTVAGEHDDTNSGPAKKKKKTEKNLFEILWKRIVLDEAHTIRNPKTKMAKACYALTAQRRWALAATPIINSPKDLGSILTFLKICRPLDNEDFFKRLLLRPLKDGAPEGADLLRNLMNHICIRRTKEVLFNPLYKNNYLTFKQMQDSEGNSLIPLPPVEMIKVPVTLSNEARAMYDEIEALSKQRVEACLRNNHSLAQSNVLSLLTRMRQMVLHTGLIPASYIEELKAGDDDGSNNAPAKAMNVTPADKARLQAKLAEAIEECEECSICFGLFEDPRITSCAHIFCLSCITESISRNPQCPLDRRALSLNDLHAPLPPMEATQAPFNAGDTSDGPDGGSSVKIDQLIELLRLTPATEKSLVFSQFTRQDFLDKIAERLDEKGIAYVRFDGRMSAKRRQEVIAQFSVPVADDDVDSGSGSRHRSRSGSVGEHSDYVMDADDSDFIDDDEDDSAYSKKKSKAKGKGKQKQSQKTSYTSHASGRNPKVMLISLKAGALGLNLTVANNVYLMDPWWQDGIESQAIDRVNRIGQTKPVHVYQLIAENTVESKVLEIQDRKKQLIQAAFSGMKRTETQRQQKETRLQGFIGMATQFTSSSESASPYANWHSRTKPHPSPAEFVPTRSTLRLAVLRNAQAEHEGFTLALFDTGADKVAVDALGRVLIVEDADYQGVVGLARRVALELPETGEFRNTWIIKQPTTSQPIERLLFVGEGGLVQTSVQGYQKGKRELKAPVGDIGELPDTLYELTALVMEGRTGYSFDMGQSPLVRQILNEIVEEP